MQADGNVTALELFEAERGQITQLFGTRTPGTPELEVWREIASAPPRA